MYVCIYIVRNLCIECFLTAVVYTPVRVRMYIRMYWNVQYIYCCSNFSVKYVCMYVCMYADVQYVCTSSCRHNHARAIKHIFQGAIHTVPVMLACETMRSSSTTSLLLHCSPVLVVFLSMKLDGGVGGLSVSRKAARMTGIIHRMSSTSIRSDMPEMV